MIDEVRGLLDQYAQWVRDKSILREVNDPYVEITTPYLDRHNDYTQIDIDCGCPAKLRHRARSLEPSRRCETRAGGLT